MKLLQGTIKCRTCGKSTVEFKDDEGFYCITCEKVLLQPASAGS